jgi:hypothetical protein
MVVSLCSPESKVGEIDIGFAPNLDSHAHALFAEQVVLPVPFRVMFYPHPCVKKEIKHG